MSKDKYPKLRLTPPTRPPDTRTWGVGALRDKMVEYGVTLNSGSTLMLNPVSHVVRLQDVWYDMPWFAAVRAAIQGALRDVPAYHRAADIDTSLAHVAVKAMQRQAHHTQPTTQQMAALRAADRLLAGYYCDSDALFGRGKWTTSRQRPLLLAVDLAIWLRYPHLMEDAAFTFEAAVEDVLVSVSGLLAPGGQQMLEHGDQRDDFIKAGLI